MAAENGWLVEGFVRVLKDRLGYFTGPEGPLPPWYSRRVPVPARTIFLSAEEPHPTPE